jgi:hypothetical protein
LDSLKETGKLMEQRRMKYDKIFALRLLPTMKEFLILDNMNFRAGQNSFTN